MLFVLKKPYSEGSTILYTLNTMKEQTWSESSMHVQVKNWKRSSGSFKYFSLKTSDEETSESFYEVPSDDPYFTNDFLFLLNVFMV